MPVVSLARRSNISPVMEVAAKQAAASWGWFRIVLLAMVATGFFVLFSGEIRDTDFYWHLKAGQHICESRSLPASDPFSYTTALSVDAYQGETITRRVNLTHEWLSQVLMYLTYLALGTPGLVLARIVLLELFCALVGWIAFHRTRNFYLSLAAALASAGMAFYFQQSRPVLATLVFTAAAMAILESRRRLWLLPALFLLWANCHGGFIVGWLVCAAYAVESLVQALQKKSTRDDGSRLLAIAASILISGLNPNGFRVIQALFFYRISAIQSNNLEWQRPIFWEPGYYSVLLFGALVSLIVAHRRALLRDWLLYLGFAAISLVALRNAIFIGLVGPILITTYMRKSRTLSVAALSVAAIGLMFSGIRTAAASDNVLAFRSADWQLPVGAADFLQAHHISAPIFNNYESGGYLIWRLWPAQRSFIDSRGLSEQAYADYKRLLYSDSKDTDLRERILNKYGIQVLVLQGFDYLSGQAIPLVVDFANSQHSGWKLVYANSAAVILMRHAPARLELPSPESALFQSLEAQCETHIHHDPLHPRCAFGLGELYAHLNQQEKANQWVTLYLAHKLGPDPEAERVGQSLNVAALNQKALSLQAQGDVAGAEVLFRQAATVAENALGPGSPDTAGTLNNLASLLEEEGNTSEAELLLRRAWAICEKALGPNDPRTASVLDNLAGVLADRGDYANAESLYRQALAVTERALGPDDATTQTIRSDLTALLQRGGR